MANSNAAKKDDAPAVEEKKQKGLRQLNSNRMRTGEYERNVWVATVEAGTTKQEILNPAFLAHVAPKLKPYDHVEVRCDDGEYWGLFLIVACDRSWAKLRELMFVQLDQSEKQDGDSEYAYKFRGPHYKHCIVRVKDGEVMFEGGQSKQEALSWLANFERNL